MNITTAEAAQQLGLTVPELLDVVNHLVGNLSDVWPSIADGFILTLQQMLEIDVVDTSTDKEESPTAKIVSEEKYSNSEVRILDKLERASKWGGNSVSFDTLRNHYCQGAPDIERDLQKLIDEDLILVGEKGNKRKGPFSLNPNQKLEIEGLVGKMRQL